MLFNDKIGIIYDTIEYGIIYFSKQAFTDMFRKKNYDIKDVFKFYEEINLSVQEIPECLFPFFYFNESPSFLTHCMIEYVNFHKHDINYLFELLKDKDMLKKRIIDYFFDNISGNDKKEILEYNSEKISIIFNKLLTDKLKYYLMFLLYNFDYVTDVLINYLNIIYKYILELHCKYSLEISKVVEKTKDKECLVLFKRFFNLDEYEASKQYVSICLLNQYVSTGKTDGFNESVYLFGYKYQKALNVECHKKITIKSFLKVLLDPIQFDIIELLKNGGEYTSSDFSRLTNTSTSTANRKVDTLLFEEGIIMISRQFGRKIYFKINPGYMLVINKLFYSYTNEFIENDKEEDMYK